VSDEPSDDLRSHTRQAGHRSTPRPKVKESEPLPLLELNGGSVRGSPRFEYYPPPTDRISTATGAPGWQDESVSHTPPPTIDERIALADRLGQLCNGHPEHVTAALPQLLEVLDSEGEPIVLAAVASALGTM
jgi:hypothetical protein